MEKFITYYSIKMEKKLKNISKETQLVNGEEIKAWAVFETKDYDTLLRAYGNLFELVDEKEEEVKEEKPTKKAKK